MLLKVLISFLKLRWCAFKFWCDAKQDKEIGQFRIWLAVGETKRLLSEADQALKELLLYYTTVVGYLKAVIPTMLKTWK